MLISAIFQIVPFGKKILVAKYCIDSCDLNYNRLFISGLLRGLNFVTPPKTYKHIQHDFEITNENFKFFMYRNVNLYDVSIYSICVELKTFVNDIAFSDPTHKAKIVEWYEKSACYIDLIFDLFKRNTFYKCIIFQGYCYESAIIRAISILKEVPVLALENTSNKNKILWDNISGITVNKNLSTNFYYKYENSVCGDTANNYAQNYVTNIQNVKKSEHYSPSKKIPKTTSKPLIALIGQVYTDSSTLFGLNKSFRDPIEIIEIVAEYSLTNDFQLFIKLHPKEVNGINPVNNQPYDNMTWQKICENQNLKNKISDSPLINIDFKNEYSTFSILDRADVVVTINSQAGLEALIKNKHVITCGNSFYNAVCPTLNAQNHEDLKIFLDKVLKGENKPLDLSTINKFFYIYFEKYCIDKNEKQLLKLL